MSAICLSQKCQAVDGCKNKEKDELETDVDCGGTACVPCGVGMKCLVDLDCGAGVCATGICSPGPTCNDGKTNGQETGPDCGGSVCPKCAAGLKCAVAADCKSSQCIDGICSDKQSCTSGTKDGKETDVDCGGGCTPCESGEACVGANDCTSKLCVNSICTAPTCSDQVKNGQEADVDCGGGTGCLPCSNGQSCQVASDCQSLLCVNSTCKAQPTCSDGVKNGTETSKDCGGAKCSPCMTGQACGVDGDCISQFCKDSVCQAPPDVLAKCAPACSPGEYCDASVLPAQCKGMTCKYPSSFGNDVQKLTILSFPAGTKGCDLDADGKPNNAFSTSLATFMVQANDTLAKSISSGAMALLLETGSLKTDGTPFACNFLTGALDPSNSSCNVMSELANCKYTVAASSYDPSSASGTCPALMTFPNMKIKDGTLTAGGSKQTFLLPVPLQGFLVNLKVNQATLQGKVSGIAAWDATTSGMICGVVAVEDVKNAVLSIPSLKDFAPLVVGLLKPDIDVDGDGKKESVSIALDFATVKGQITGLSK